MKKELIEGQKVWFESENIPMNVLKANDDFAICSRKLDMNADIHLIEHEVDMGAYLNFDIAWCELKDYPVYSIIDFKKGQRGVHNNVFNPYDLKKPSDVNDLMNDLVSGSVELSYRHKLELDINWKKTNNEN